MYNNSTVSNSTTTNYTYGDTTWGDLLTGYDGEGITYDANGNPLSYYNGKRYTFSWQYGRRLASLGVDGKAYTYTYNADGLRVTKTVDGVVHTYYYDGTELLMEKWGNCYLRFTYDEQGRPFSVDYYNGTVLETYYYVLNLQGDVIEIRNSINNVVCKYTYDAWGKMLSMKDGSGNAITSAGHIGSLNPLRYRGYYYDNETGLYYLRSRYYDPVICRFVNADGYISTGQSILGNNMFAYCINNPVIYEDFDGEMPAAAGILASGAAAGGSNAWNPAGWVILGVTVTAFAIWVIPWERVGQSVSNEWNSSKDSTKSNSISRSISKAVSKTKTKILNGKRRHDYWIASYVEYGDGRGTYIPTTPISYSSAISYVRGGGNVFADSRSNAYRLALAVGNGQSPTKPEIHRDKNGSTLGYWWHYHDRRRIGGHIFYV